MASAPAASAASGPVRIEAVVADTEVGRRRYLHQARCLTRERNASTAALIGLTSLALFKSMTSPHAKDLAGLGVAGGAVYLLGQGDETGVAQRRLVYYAGADALGCVLTAAEPYRNLPGAWGGKDLNTLASEVSTARSALDAPIRQMSVLAQPVSKRQSGRSPPAECAGVDVSGCSSPNATTKAVCEAIQARCSPRGGSTVTLSPHPDVSAMRSALILAREDLDKLLLTKVDVQVQLDGVPRELYERSAAIQTKVAAEVDRTFPEPTTVIATAQTKLKNAGAGITRAPAFGTAQSNSTPTGSKPADRPGEQLATAQETLDKANLAASSLRQAVNDAQRRLATANAALQSCRFTAPSPPAQGNPPAAPDPAAGPAESAAPQTQIVTTELDAAWLARKLGLDPAASGKALETTVADCQKRLGQSNPTGISIDPATLAAISNGACRKDST